MNKLREMFGMIADGALLILLAFPYWPCSVSEVRMTVSSVLSAAAQELTLEVFGNERAFMQKLNEVMNSLDATPEAVDHEVKPE